MGGGQPDNVTQTNKVELGPEQKKIFNLAFPSIEEFARQPTAPYRGDRLAGFDPAEVAAQEGMLETAGGMEGVSGASLDAQKLLLDPGFMLNPNQYLDAATGSVRRQGMEDLESSLRNVRGASQVAGGQFSGGSTKAGQTEGVATARGLKGIEDAIAKMYLENYTQGRSLMADAAKNAGTVMQNALLPNQVRSAVGQQRRQMEQAELGEAEQQYYLEQEWPLLVGKQLLSTIQSMPGATGVTSVSGAGGGFGGQQALGLGLSLLGALGGGPVGLMGGMGMGK